jgi:hypothetical protein
MKGEQVPEHGRWAGNPAGEMHGSTADLRIGSRPPTPGLMPLVPADESVVGVQLEQNPAPGRSGRTLVRRGIGAAAVLFLLGGAVVYYREAPDFATSASSPTSPSAAPSGAAPSAGPSRASDPRPSPSVATPRASDSTRSASAPKAIQLNDPSRSARPFQTVRISGTYRGGADTFLQLQRWETGKWLAFPLPARTDKSGRFTTYVDLGRPGRYQLRLLDPASGTASKTFVLVIRG